MAAAFAADAISRTTGVPGVACVSFIIYYVSHLFYFLYYIDLLYTYLFCFLFFSFLSCSFFLLFLSFLIFSFPKLIVTIGDCRPRVDQHNYSNQKCTNGSVSSYPPWWCDFRFIKGQGITSGIRLSSTLFSLLLVPLFLSPELLWTPLSY